jgi:hypothetical protein
MGGFLWRDTNVAASVRAGRLQLYATGMDIGRHVWACRVHICLKLRDKGNDWTCVLVDNVCNN